MRLKKLLSTVLVIAMLASMAVTAFADTEFGAASNPDTVIAAAGAEDEEIVIAIEKVEAIPGYMNKEDVPTDYKAELNENTINFTATNLPRSIYPSIAKEEINHWVTTKITFSGELEKNLKCQFYIDGRHSEEKEIGSDNAVSLFTCLGMGSKPVVPPDTRIEFISLSGKKYAPITLSFDASKVTFKEEAPIIKTPALESVENNGNSDVKIENGKLTFTAKDLEKSDRNNYNGYWIRAKLNISELEPLSTVEAVWPEGIIHKSTEIDSDGCRWIWIDFDAEEAKKVAEGDCKVTLKFKKEGITYEDLVIPLDLSDVTLKEEKPPVTDKVTAEMGAFEPTKDNAKQYTGTLTLTNPTETNVENVTITGKLEGATVAANPATVTVPAKSENGGTVTSDITVTFTGEDTPADGEYTVQFSFGEESSIDAIEGKLTVENGGTVDPNPDPDPNPDEGNNGGSGGSGSSNSNSSSGGGLRDDDEDTGTSASAPSANVDSKGAVNTAKANSDAKKAVSNAKNGTANVDVTNAKTVDSAALNAMAKTAAKEDIALTMTAKTTDRSGNVVATLKFDTAEAAKAVAAAGNKEIKLGVETNTKNTKSAASLFKKWFSNKNITAVKMAQKGEFGFNVAATVKVDLKHFNKDSLHFYSYNAATNTYKEITNAKATVDAKGFVHFNTAVGNYIIITDAPIASK